MLRECSRCGRPFGPRDLIREESKDLEAERKALGLRGLLFRYYRCPACGCAAIFLDVARQEGEGLDAFDRRRGALEEELRQLRGDRIEVVVRERHPVFEFG